MFLLYDALTVAAEPPVFFSSMEYERVSISAPFHGEVYFLF